MYPQAVYFPIRTLYLTLKIEQRERYKSGKSTQLAALSRPPPLANLTSCAIDGESLTVQLMPVWEIRLPPPPVP